MTRVRPTIVVLMTLFCVIWLQRSTSATACQYSKYRWVHHFNQTCGCDAVDVWRDVYLCEDENSSPTSDLYADNGGGFGFCTCTLGGQLGLLAMPEGGEIPGENSCNQSCGIQPTVSIVPERCDGRDFDLLAPYDEQCGNDEHSCSAGAADRDNAPVRFSSGRVESKPVPRRIFRLPYRLIIS